MRKPKELRAVIESAIPELKRNPDRLLIFIDAGKIQHTAVRGLSFMYAYTINLIVTDFIQSPDIVIVPMLAWLRENQPNLFLNAKEQEDGISFEVDVINAKSIDLSIKIRLTESVRVDIAPKPNKPTDWLATITHLSEPPIAEERPDVAHWELLIEGQTVAEWDAQPAFVTDN